MMTEKLWELYSACFPGNVRSEKTVRELLGRPDNTCLVEAEGEKLLAASVVNGNTVLMLCVLPEYRRQGIGSRLLEQSEDLVRQRGFSEIQFCDGPGYLTPGVPLTAENQAFFQKRGYVHSWGECECVDMSLLLRDFTEKDAALGRPIDGVVYRWAGKEDRRRVIDCVESSYPEFAEYYRDGSLYEERSAERVLLAETDGLVCGALMVGRETEQKGVGSVGCTVTRTEYRGRGIATRMVQLGTGYLKASGLSKGFLGYTYTDIVPMYQRSGYQVCMKYMMAKKRLG